MYDRLGQTVTRLETSLCLMCCPRITVIHKFDSKRVIFPDISAWLLLAEGNLTRRPRIFFFQGVLKENVVAKFPYSFSCYSSSC